MNTAWIRALAAQVGAALLLAGCGGGVGSGGTGDVASGYGSGTITGFGSVFVDGERYDDTGARYEYDTEAGAPDMPEGPLARADLAEGQRVELRFETDGNARRASVFRISPALVGPVTSLSPLSVAGQPVRVNTDAARGPVTRFGGDDASTQLSSASQIRLGDRLEVHGAQVADGAGTALQATRIDRLRPSHGRWLRLSGTVSALAADGRSFRLGNLTVSLAPRGNGNARLQDGARVQVWTREAITGSTLVAERVRIVERPIGPQQEVQLSGVVAGCADRARSEYVCIDGTPVALGDARFGAGLGAATLTDGRYVIASGRFDAAAGAVRGARLRLPQQ